MDFYDLVEELETPNTQDIVQALENHYDVPIYVVINDRTYPITAVSSDGTEVWIHAG